MLVLLISLLLSSVACKINCATTPGTGTDLFALQDFKDGTTTDPTGALNSWNSNTSYCMWNGVECSSEHAGRVMALELSGLNLAGQISPSIGNLTFLKTLNLSENSLSGQLPPFSQFHKLQILDLSSNSLHDSIPDGLSNCSNLRELRLRKNNLFGQITPKLGLLTNLSVLLLS